jgi:hypothetical protein
MSSSVRTTPARGSTSRCASVAVSMTPSCAALRHVVLADDIRICEVVRQQRVPGSQPRLLRGVLRGDLLQVYAGGLPVLL